MHSLRISRPHWFILPALVARTAEERMSYHSSQRLQLVVGVHYAFFGHAWLVSARRGVLLQAECLPTGNSWFCMCRNGAEDKQEVANTARERQC